MTYSNGLSSAAMTFSLPHTLSGPVLFLWLIMASLGIAPAAAQVSLQTGPHLTAMGGAGAALPGDLWGHSNPATAASLSTRQVGFFAGQAFELAELRLASARLAQPLPFAVAVVGAQAFGFDQYREVQVPVGMAREVRLGTTRALAIGATVHYHHVQLAGYGSDGSVGVTLGAQVDVTRTLRGGVQAVNVNAPRLGDGDDLPRWLQVGLAYRPREDLILLLDAVKDVLFPLSYRGGIELRPVEMLHLRGGVASEPTRLTAGLGLDIGRLTADIAAERHLILGWSPAVGVRLR